MTEIHINEFVSSIRAVDPMLSPQMVERIVCEVLKAVDERQEYRQRVNAERRVTSGVRDELEGES
jgi:hypothetical protein